MKKKFFWLSFFAFLVLAAGMFFFTCFESQAQYAYTPMEKIPGSEGAVTFPEFIKGIYKFAIWAVGICAVLMLTVGGFMYMTSAGNTSKNGAAKKVVTDALIGLGVALGAYLLLFIINPDLVKINVNLNYLSGNVEGVGGGSGSGSGTGNCQPISTGPCSVDNLKPYFGENAAKASAICVRESGGREGTASGRASTVDICRPNGPAVSWGLFQFNLTANKMGGLDCPSSVGPMYTGKNKNCSIKDQALFDKCVSAAKNPDTNIKAAVSLSNGGNNWSKWGANKDCKF